MTPPQRHSTEPAQRTRLTHELLAGLASGAWADPDTYGRMFRQVAAFQRRFGGAAQPQSLRAAVPVELFKYRRFATFASSAPEGTMARAPSGASPGGYFLSSGTTRGAERRACHWFPDFQLYEATLARGFAQAVLGADGLDTAWNSRAPRWNLLVPADPRWWRNPHSSLAHMGRCLWRSMQHHTDAQLHCIDPAAPPQEFRQALRRLIRGTDRVTLGFGTGFGFLHFSDRLAALRLSAPLNPASRVMETGGYKGRGRELAPAELHAELAQRFELPPTAVFAEYGMTELSSQAYQVSDTAGAPFPASPVYWPAETLRIRVLDAAGLPCPPGEVGLIEATDLMNLTSACRVLLGDLGVLLPPRRRRGSQTAIRTASGEFTRHRFQVLGRAARLAQRGCGLADDLQWLERLAAPTGPS